MAYREKLGLAFFQSTADIMSNVKTFTVSDLVWLKSTSFLEDLRHMELEAGKEG